MKINTKYFGEMDIAEAEVVRFPEQLPGLHDSHEYVIIRFYDDDDSLLCLQSLNEPALAFVVMNPFYLFEDYMPVLAPEDFRTLRAERDTLLVFYVIVVVHEDWIDSTVNLRCPIAINPEMRLGKQVVMDNSSYGLRHPLNAGMRKGD